MANSNMKHGLSVPVEFRRLIIPTVHVGLLGKIKAPFIKPRVEMTKDFEIPYKKGINIVIPKGFTSDGGSVPLFGLWLVSYVSYKIGFYPDVSFFIMLLGLMLNAFGLMLAPFLAHDFMYRYKCLIMCDGSVMYVDSLWRANLIMLQINYATNKMYFLGAVAYIGVTLGGWYSWKSHRNKDFTGINGISRWSRLLRKT